MAISRWHHLEHIGNNRIILLRHGGAELSFDLDGALFLVYRNVSDDGFRLATVGKHQNVCIGSLVIGGKANIRQGRQRLQAGEKHRRKRGKVAGGHCKGAVAIFCGRGDAVCIVDAIVVQQRPDVLRVRGIMSGIAILRLAEHDAIQEGQQRLELPVRGRSDGGCCGDGRSSRG